MPLFKSRAEKFFCAIDFGKMKKVEKMLKKGIDPNINIGGDWVYPLILTSFYSGKPEAAKLLLQYGADTDVRTSKGQTALHLCIEFDHPQIAEMLIDAGTDLNAKTVNGLTPSHYCIEYNRPQIAEMLLEAGADINSKSLNGYSLIDYVISFDRPEWMKMLLAHGLQIDLKKRDGGKLLSLAFNCESVKMANYLLSKGADILCRNDDSFFPLDRATQSKNATIRLAAKKGFEQLTSSVLEWDVNALDEFITVPASSGFQKLCYKEFSLLFIQHHKTEHTKCLFDNGAHDILEANGDMSIILKALIRNTSPFHESLVEKILKANPNLIFSILSFAKEHNAENTIQLIQTLEEKIEREQENQRAADALQKENDQKMINCLRDLCKAYAANDPSYHHLELEATKIGEELNAQGGIAAMRRIFAHVQDSPGSRTLEMHWAGIGEWRG